MKTQQRSFTVEIKSSRRRSKMQPKSIWGDTDFKALAREAESAHFFKSSTPSADAIADVEGQSDAPFDTDSIMDSAGEAKEIDPVSAPLVTEPSESPCPPIRVSKQSKAVAPRAAAGIANSDIVRLKRPSYPEAVLIPQDLEKLEDENRLLRAALIIHLQQQNAELRKMLGRFA